MFTQKIDGTQQLLHNLKSKEFKDQMFRVNDKTVRQTDELS